MADILATISIAFFIAAVIMLAAAIYIFIKFQIPDVINDLNGKNVMRLAEEQRKLARSRNAMPVYQGGGITQPQGSLPLTSGRIRPDKPASTSTYSFETSGNSSTVLLDERDAGNTNNRQEVKETYPSTSTAKTGSLRRQEQKENTGTQLLTEVPEQKPENLQNVQKEVPEELVIELLEEVMLIHTAERIG